MPYSKMNHDSFDDFHHGPIKRLLVGNADVACDSQSLKYSETSIHPVYSLG